MVFESDHENMLADLGCKYIFASQHRNNNSDKSQWTITMPDEIQCFKKANKEKWILAYHGWGLKLGSDQTLEVLGINPHREELKIAKFIDSSKNRIWHGYPADYIRNSQDRPNIEVLTSWRDNGIIGKHHMIKIRKGQACNL